WSAWKTAYLHGYAKPARCRDVHMAISNERLTSFGLVSMLDYYTKRCVTC
ncbi:group II intron reverse transcriptase/maturase, partial [Lachnospiraceae bacterium 45-W7]